MNSALTPCSSNGKTGPIAVSTTSRHSCAPGCPLAGENGCYAEAGYYTRTHWDAVTDGSRGVPPDEFIRRVSRLKTVSMFRHNVAGDLWHDGLGKIDLDLAQRLAHASKHFRAAWTYTHHKLTASNLLAIRGMRAFGMTVNVSCEKIADAVRATTELKLPAVCVVPRDAPAHFREDGILFRQCPATFEGSPTNCSTCGNGSPLCAIGDRDFVVTFPAHGGRASAAEKACG